ncbi:copper homeostasis membrane protein CopD [Sphingopyxis sp.]|uniref:copper homeostasis membrane protein CopD n=1 Tax=Sphingopyxis sp. TaxID=1908224 RepID=UPI002ED90D9E
MTDLPVIGIRLALYADLMLLTGLAAFPLYSLGRDERRDTSFVPGFAHLLRWFCALGLLASTVGIIVLTANMHGVGAFSVKPAMLRAMVGDTAIGAAWLVRTLALLVAAIAAWNFTRRPTIAAAILVAAGAVALTTLAWAGHAGASDGLAGTVHRVADALHMIAAAIWLGAIAAFLLLLRPEHGAILPEQTALAVRSLDRFARIGTICVLVITATGLINVQVILGFANIGRAAASPYGQLLLIKLLLFGSMLVLAAANRWRLTPALDAALVDDDPALATAAIRRSLAAEAAAGAAILALVAWFGMLEP